jgi:hypothetical protein
MGEETRQLVMVGLSAAGCGSQVFASVFKPRPQSHLLPGAETWADEVAPLVMGIGVRTGAGGGADPEGTEGSGGGWDEGLGGTGGGFRRCVPVGGAAIDGLFTDCPAELLRLLRMLELRCGEEQERRGAMLPWARGGAVSL